MKRVILLAILFVGLSVVHAQESSPVRKGLHVGFHLTPGSGTIFTEAYENLSIGYGMMAGLDVNYYFNDLLGVQTGVTYFNLPWRYEFFETANTEDYMEITANVHSIGIPVHFLLTTGKKTVGFYLEAGFAVYFPVYYRSDLDKNILETSTAMFASELTAGINLRATDKINFQIAAFSNTSLPVFSNIGNGSIGLLSGLKLGMTFDLSK